MGGRVLLYLQYDYGQSMVGGRVLLYLQYVKWEVGSCCT